MLTEEKKMDEKSQILKILEKSEEDNEWFSGKYIELQRKYEGKIVAVKEKKVICAADTVEELLEKLKEKGEDVGYLLIESIPPKNISFILCGSFNLA